MEQAFQETQKRYEEALAGRADGHLTAWDYSLDDRGNFINRHAILEMVKGWGKSPLLGGISLAELGASSDLDAAPVLFDGWDAEGEPLGRPWGSGESPPALEVAIEIQRRDVAK